MFKQCIYREYQDRGDDSEWREPLQQTSTLVNRHNSGLPLARWPLIFLTLLSQVLHALPDRVSNDKGDDITEEAKVHA